MAFFDLVDFDNHEQVVYCSDEASGLKAIIAVHSTALGPAAGGCRFSSSQRTREDGRSPMESVGRKSGSPHLQRHD
mgnify:CR=1 FL=1